MCVCVCVLQRAITSTLSLYKQNQLQTLIVLLIIPGYNVIIVLVLIISIFTSRWNFLFYLHYCLFKINEKKPSIEYFCFCSCCTEIVSNRDPRTEVRTKPWHLCTVTPLVTITNYFFKATCPTLLITIETSEPAVKSRRSGRGETLSAGLGTEALEFTSPKTFQQTFTFLFTNCIFEV